MSTLLCIWAVIGSLTTSFYPAHVSHPCKPKTMKIRPILELTFRLIAINMLCMIRVFPKRVQIWVLIRHAINNLNRFYTYKLNETVCPGNHSTRNRLFTIFKLILNNKCLLIIILAAPIHTSHRGKVYPIFWCGWSCCITVAGSMHHKVCFQSTHAHITKRLYTNTHTSDCFSHLIDTIGWFLSKNPEDQSLEKEVMWRCPLWCSARV